MVRMRTLPLLLVSLSLSAQIMVAPVPQDPHELVTGMARLLTEPADRANAMALLEKAKQNADMHMPGAAPFAVKIVLNVSGNGANTGTGEITETWLNGRNWRYDQTLGSYSETRVAGPGQTFGKHAGYTPMAVQMVRASMFWPVGGNPSVNVIRTADATWNGKPVTAILLAGGQDRVYPGRHWVDTEYVVDNATGLLQIYSRAPGTYVVYGYSKGIRFHGRSMPDSITIFMGGNQVVEAQLVNIQDAGNVDAAFLKPDSQMHPDGPASVGMNMRFPLNAPDPTNSGVLKQVIIHATIDNQGNVVDSQLSATADSALVEPALDLVKKAKFSPGSPMDAYINVRFGL